MSRVYDIIDKIANGNQKPTLKIDADHTFKINNSFPAAVAIKAYAEDKKLDDMDRIFKIVGVALDKEATDYIKKLDLPLPLYTTIVNVIMAAISDMSLEEIEQISEDKKSYPVNKWYDIYDDWDLIESSFAMQYNIRLRENIEMSWSEFCSLLKGIMPKTPLGQIVSTRSEEDNDILDHFTEDQHKIRNDWRCRDNPIMNMSEEEKAEKIKEVQLLFAKAFS